VLRLKRLDLRDYPRRGPPGDWKSRAKGLSGEMSVFVRVDLPVCCAANRTCTYGRLNFSRSGYHREIRQDPSPPPSNLLAEEISLPDPHILPNGGTTAE
jgi:hypothetical protein